MTIFYIEKYNNGSAIWQPIKGMYMTSIAQRKKRE